MVGFSEETFDPLEPFQDHERADGDKWAGKAAYRAPAFMTITITIITHNTQLAGSTPRIGVAMPVKPDPAAPYLSLRLVTGAFSRAVPANERRQRLADGHADADAGRAQ